MARGRGPNKKTIKYYHSYQNVYPHRQMALNPEQRLLISLMTGHALNVVWARICLSHSHKYNVHI